MEKAFNNEVMLFGKLYRAHKLLRINNQDATQLMIEVQDDNFPDKTNMVLAYAMTGDRKQFRQYIGKEIGINGHVITHMGTKIIIDVLRLA